MKHYVFFANALLLLPVCLKAAEDTSTPPVSEVVERMVRRDAQRQLLTQGYAGMRRYVLENDGMQKRAEMVVRVTGDSDGTKHFEIVSEQGWKAAQNHVLHKMLEFESETSSPEARAKTRLCPDNYEFQMAGTEMVDDQLTYAIDVTPKRHDKYLFTGRIWVDAKEYALVRADGNPAKNPSFWTKRVHFVHTYQKDGQFWFPRSTESITDARIFGRTNLTIDYFDYKPNSSNRSDEVATTAQETGLNEKN